jgi:hypothetical protein
MSHSGEVSTYVVFLVVTPCGLAGGSSILEKPIASILTLKMEVKCSSETLVTACKTTRLTTQECNNLEVISQGFNCLRPDYKGDFPSGGLKNWRLSLHVQVGRTNFVKQSLS